MESTPAESRPTRRRVRKLTEEQLKEMLDSDTDCSDDDPDFYTKPPSPKNLRSRRRLRRSRDSSQSSEDVDDPDEAPLRKKATKVKKELPKKKITTAGKEHKDNPKRSSSQTRVYVPPPLENPAQYTAWNDDVTVVEPVRKAADKTYYCSIRGCESGNTSDKDGLWLFSLPENEGLMSTWDERLPIDYERNRPQSPRICFRHFRKADFVRRQKQLLGLRGDAVPLKTEFVGNKLCVMKEAF